MIVFFQCHYCDLYRFSLRMKVAKGATQGHDAPSNLTPLVARPQTGLWTFPSRWAKNFSVIEFLLLPRTKGEGVFESLRM